MKIDVYDSYFTNKNGQLMHFDVFVPHNTTPQQALAFGQQWLESLAENGAELKQEKCNFCHSELANPKVAQTIATNGYFIYQMEGCPAFDWRLKEYKWNLQPQ